MNDLNPRERRILAIGILVGLIAILWLGVFSPLIGGFTARQAERQSLLATYQRNQRLLDAIPVWRAEAEAQKKTAGAFALAAPSQIQAQEILKQRMAAAMGATGAPAPVIQDLQADLPPGWIGARADVQLTLAQLNDSLRRLESEEPYVVVDYVSINAERAFQSGRAGPLDVRLELSVPFRLADAQQP
jgi:general secretion pathway protein M